MLVVAAIALRLPGLGNPPQDAHHVRQSDTASIARIMARDGVDLLHPRIGWACACGEILPKEGAVLACARCGATYREEEGLLQSQT